MIALAVAFGICLYLVVAICLMLYLAFGVYYGVLLTYEYIRALRWNEEYGSWSLAVGGGWFLMLGGCDVLRAHGDMAPLGPWMIALSFAAWLWAGSLFRSASRT